MSRHEFDGTDPKHHIVIGWDPPLRTYFAQVHDRSNPDPDDDPVLWVGASPPSIQTVEELQAHLAPYCTLTQEQREALADDEANDR